MQILTAVVHQADSTALTHLLLHQAPGQRNKLHGSIRSIDVVMLSCYQHRPDQRCYHQDHSIAAAFARCGRCQQCNGSLAVDPLQSVFDARRQVNPLSHIDPGCNGVTCRHPPNLLTITSMPNLQRLPLQEPIFPQPHRAAVDLDDFPHV